MNIVNKDYWNIVKGLSIFLVVAGHGCWFATQFVNTFHLAIFFFISAYLFSEKKYADKPFYNFYKRTKNLWTRYVLFSSFFVLIHNKLFQVGLLPDSHKYDFKTILEKVLEGIVMRELEHIGEPLWFVPVLIISSSIFGCIIWLSNFFQNTYVKYCIIIILTAIIGLSGLVAIIQYNLTLTYYLQTALIHIPIMTLAYFLKKALNNKIETYLKWYIALPLLVFLITISFSPKWLTLLCFNIIPGYWQYYVASFSGIYVILYIAKIIIKLPYIKNYFEFIGIYSFEIMALHMLLLKLIDRIYAYIMFDNISPHFALWTNAYSQKLWPIYMLIGTLIPALFAFLISHFFPRLSRIFNIPLYSTYERRKFK